MKTKPHIFILLAVLVLVGVIVSPVSASSYTITAEPLGGELHATGGKITDVIYDASPDGNAVQRISVDVPTGTSVNYTLWYGSGASVSGWMEYNPSTGCDDFISWFDSFCQYSGVAIGSDIQGYNYRGLQEVGRIDIVGYARNETSTNVFQPGFIVYDTVFGISERRAMAFYPINNPGDLVIYKFQITSNNPVQVFYYTNTRENVLKAATVTPLEAINDWVAFATKIAGSVFDFVLFLFAVIKFFFIDNLLLILVLYLSVSMAYSAVSSRNVFQFYTKFFRFQRSMLEFITSLWNILIQIISSFRGIFRI